MIKIDRMDIDDAGANPRNLARSILDQLPHGTIKVPVREIAEAIDIYDIREEYLSGLEGALIVHPNKSEGAILINKDRSETRKRYTIAHELGHYVHPYHRANSHEGFFCKAKDLLIVERNSNNLHARMEAQANEFAAELLMPYQAVADFIRAKGEADLSHILELSNRHVVSREAAARRYVSGIGEAAAIVFSCEGIIRYARYNEFFPHLSVFSRNAVPQRSVSASSKAAIGEITEPIEVDGNIWLYGTRGVTLFEQTLAQKNGYRMTLLTAEIEDPEDAETEWEEPSFYGRK